MSKFLWGMAAFIRFILCIWKFIKIWVVLTVQCLLPLWQWNQILQWLVTANSACTTAASVNKKKGMYYSHRLYVGFHMSASDQCSHKTDQSSITWKPGHPNVCNVVNLFNKSLHVINMITTITEHFSLIKWSLFPFLFKYPNSCSRMQKMHCKSPKFSKFFGGAYPRTPLEVHSPPTPTILPPTQIPIENPVI